MENVTPIRAASPCVSGPDGSGHRPEHPSYDTADQISQCAGLARVLMQAIGRLEDEADMEPTQMRALVDIRLSAEVLCERLAITVDAMPNT